MVVVLRSACRACALLPPKHQMHTQQMQYGHTEQSGQRPLQSLAAVDAVRQPADRDDGTVAHFLPLARSFFLSSSSSLCLISVTLKSYSKPKSFTRWTGSAAHTPHGVNKGPIAKRSCPLRQARHNCHTCHGIVCLQVAGVLLLKLPAASQREEPLQHHLPFGRLSVDR